MVYIKFIFTLFLYLNASSALASDIGIIEFRSIYCPTLKKEWGSVVDKNILSDAIIECRKARDYSDIEFIVENQLQKSCFEAVPRKPGLTQQKCIFKFESFKNVRLGFQFGVDLANQKCEVVTH